jgi:hypothetical protein
MKIWRNATLYWLFSIISFVIFISGCSTPTEKLIKLAYQHELNENYFKAAELYELAISKSNIEKNENDLNIYLKASERLADINTYHLANPKVGLYWLKQRRPYLIHTDEIIQNQKKIIKLYMDFLGDYEQVVIEAYGVLSYELSIDDRCPLILDLSLALFQLNRQDEAEQELSQCLGNIPIQKSLAFKLASLEIDILMARKKHQQAIYRIETLKDEFKELDVEQNLKLTQALAYEELGDYSLAQKVLTELLEDQKYLDRGYIKLRIERLKQKETQQAGARLRRKK